MTEQQLQQLIQAQSQPIISTEYLILTGIFCLAIFILMRPVIIWYYGIGELQRTLNAINIKLAHIANALSNTQPDQDDE